MLCPKAGCGNGLLPEGNERRIQCPLCNVSFSVSFLSPPPPFLVFICGSVSFSSFTPSLSPSLFTLFCAAIQDWLPAATVSPGVLYVKWTSEKVQCSVLTEVLVRNYQTHSLNCVLFYHHVSDLKKDRKYLTVDVILCSFLFFRFPSMCFVSSVKNRFTEASVVPSLLPRRALQSKEV